MVVLVPVRIFADFNHQDAQGRVWLTGSVSRADLSQQHDDLRAGMPVLLYTEAEDYVEVPAVLYYNADVDAWLAEWLPSAT